MDFHSWINKLKVMADSLHDPKKILGDDFYNFDKFIEWVEIPLHDEDKDDAHESLVSTFNIFIQYKYFDHASIIITVINKNNDRL